MSRYDARQLVDNIERLIAGTPLSSIPSPFLHAPEPVSDEPESEGAEGEGQTSTVRALSLSIFPSLRQHQRVDKVPDGTRLAFVKKAVMRMMRIVSGPQAAFNYFVYSAFEVVAQHLDAVRRRLQKLEGARRREKADVDVKLAGIHQAVEVLETRLSEEVLTLRAAVNMTLERMAGDFENRLAHAAHVADKRAAAISQMAADYEGRLVRLGQLVGEYESRLAAQDVRDRVEGLDKRISQVQFLTEEYAKQSKQMIDTVLQSSQHMVEHVWKGLEERDVQLLNTTKGVQSCHLHISRLEGETREAQARLLVLNEQINLQLDVLEKMRRQLEQKHAEQMRSVELAIAGPSPIAAAPPVAPSPLEQPSASEIPRESTPEPRPLVPQPIEAFSVAEGSEGADEALYSSERPPVDSSVPSLEAHQVDLAYLRFQRQYRGDEAMLKERQAKYVKLILERSGAIERTEGRASRKRLLDLACGDGFFLDLWRDQDGWDVHGVDLSAAMARLGRNAGLSIEQADAFAYLESGPEKAWDAISSFQFIEHLDKSELIRLMRACKRALRPGGLLLFETLNPHSMISHKWFHLDLTHKRLIFPEMASLLLESLGMRVLETTAISEVHESHKLQLLGDARLQANFDRLNEFLFGKQDYYILAQRP